MRKIVVRVGVVVCGDVAKEGYQCVRADLEGMYDAGVLQDARSNLDELALREAPGNR